MITTATPVEALPCPFCGNPPSIGDHRDDDDDGYAFCECEHCNEMKGATRFVGVHADNIDDAIARWNERSLTTSAIEVGNVAEGTPAATVAGTRRPDIIATIKYDDKTVVLDSHAKEDGK